MSGTITGSTIAERYRVTAYLRPARMGDLYLARTVDTDKPVEIKLLDPTLFDNEEAVRRFQREMKVSQALSHPCCMQVLEVGRSQHGPFLAIEHVQGELLSDVIEDRGRLAPEQAVHVAGQVALALGAAHDLGVIHRDLSPDVILVAEQEGADMVKVTDFGLSRLQQSDSETDAGLTAVGVRIGTPTYMAPEYIEEYDLDYRADYYGLGVVLYEMLTGQPPFVGRPYKVMDMHVNDAPPRPSESVEGLPSWIDDLVLWMMAKEPDQRPQHAGDIIEAIGRGTGHAVQPTERHTPAPEPPQVAPSHDDTDPILVRFIQQQIRESGRAAASSPPGRDACWVVERVAPTSVAGNLGITQGMLLHLPGGTTQGPLLPVDIDSEIVNDRLYHFYDANLRERVELRATGVAVGVTVMRTVENIVAHYDPLNPDAFALLDLWKQEAWEHLETLSWRTLTQQRGATGILATGLFAKFLGSDKVKLSNHPALLFHGVAQVEQGAEGKGMPSVHEYRAKHSQHWGGVFKAISLFYAATEKARGGARDLASDLLQQAVALAPLPRLSSGLESLTGRPANTTPWVGNTFPEYSMDTVENQPGTRLSDALGRMDASQLLCVCMLGGFRGNRAYDGFMRRYVNYNAYFSEFLSELHVVTTATERESGGEWYVGEDLAQHSGVPMFVLHDYRAFVQRAVKPTVVPTIFLIDKTGTVVHQGSLTPPGLWDALAKAGRWRMMRLRGST